MIMGGSVFSGANLLASFQGVTLLSFVDFQSKVLTSAAQTVESGCTIYASWWHKFNSKIGAPLEVPRNKSIPRWRISFGNSLFEIT